MDTTSRSCPWCSETIPTGANACPKCGAAVEGAPAATIPGVTEVDPTARLGSDEGAIPDAIDPASWLQAGHEATAADHDAFARPSQEVLAEMRRMELEAQIANAGGTVMSPTDDEAKLAEAPSEEAVDALAAGLIEAPTKELEERAKALEMERKEREQ